MLEGRGRGAQAPAVSPAVPRFRRVTRACSSMAAVARSGIRGSPSQTSGRRGPRRTEDRREQPEDHHADEDHHHERDHGQPDAAEHRPDVEEHPGRMAGTATIDPMTEVPSPAELPASLTIRRGRIVFRARRPVALVLPLLAVTEIAGRHLPAHRRHHRLVHHRRPADRTGDHHGGRPPPGPRADPRRPGPAPVPVQQPHPLGRHRGGRHRQGGEPRDPRVQARSRYPAAPAPARGGSAPGGQRAVRRWVVRRFPRRRSRRGARVVTRYLNEPGLREMLPVTRR